MNQSESIKGSKLKMLEEKKQSDKTSLHMAAEKYLWSTSNSNNTTFQSFEPKTELNLASNPIEEVK